MPRLTDSVPPEVKTTSIGSQSSAAGEPLAGVFEHAARVLTGAVDGRRVADDLARLEPGLARLGSQRGRGGVIEVDHSTPPSRRNLPRLTALLL